MIKDYKFHIKGMHCKNCVLFIEDTIKHDDRVKKVKVSLSKSQVNFTGDFGDMSEKQVADYFSNKTKERNYYITEEKELETIKIKDYILSAVFAFSFIFLFILLQKAGLINLISTDNIGFGTAFVVGIVASLSTCMATAGGLLLSLSANYSKGKTTALPHISFHISRLISFFIFGGLIGLIGSVLKLGTTFLFILTVFVAFVMLVLGLNLLEIPFARKIQFALPNIFKGNLAENGSSIFAQILIGLLTFILPCGFTQAMQVYTLSSGGFLKGALTMFTFALGTLPVLALISFGSYSIKNNKYKTIFFKTAGFIVILFALFNLLNALASMQIINPIFNF